MLIYVVQGALFVIAYFMRFESDLLILGFVTGLFAVCIGVLQFATRSGWRLRSLGKDPSGSAVPRLMSAIHRPGLLPRLSYLAIAAAVGAYAALIVIETATLSGDFRILIVALLAVVMAFSAVLRGAPLSLVEKAVLYVTATLLVYLEAVVLPSDRVLSVIGWIAVAVAAAATAVRLRLYNDRRFLLTPLDLIVLFMALVVPSLLDSLNLPHGGALAIAKLVILFYALEMLVTSSGRRAAWVRIAAVTVLAITSGLAPG